MRWGPSGPQNVQSHPSLSRGLAASPVRRNTKGKRNPTPHMSMFANNPLLGGGVRVWIREQRMIKRRSKALLSL